MVYRVSPYLLAASMLTLVPITASATATGSENEKTVQAVQQARKPLPVW